MSSPVGYPQRGAYPMFSSTSQGDVPVGKNGANLIPVMANVTSSSGGIKFSALPRVCGPKNVIHPGITVNASNTMPDTITAGSESKVTVDLTNATPYGAGCVVVAETYPGGTITIDWNKKFALSEADSIEVWLYVDATSNMSSIKLSFYSGSSNYIAALTFDVRSGWNNVTLPWSRFAPFSGATKAMSFDKVRYAFASGAGKTGTIKIGPISINKKSRPAICFTFDDSFLSDYEYAYQILKKYGYTGLSYIMPGQVNGLPRYLTHAQMQEMYAGGWKFGLHNNINWINAGAVAARASVVAGRVLLNTLGVKTASHASYPENKYDASIISMLQEEGVKWCRTVIEENQSCPVVSPMLLRGTGIKIDDQAANFALIDAAIAKSQTLIFVIHEIGYISSVGFPDILKPEAFEEVVRYCYDKGYPVANLVDWCDDYDSGHNVLI